MIGELYGQALEGEASPDIEFADGRVSPLPVGRWLSTIPGDESMLEHCAGPTLDVGAGPGRLTVALAERGVPALAIDVTPQAVRIARSRGALALQRDVFSDLPGTGRWASLLLADGNIGIRGDPVGLLIRARELVAPTATVVVEVGQPGTRSRRESARLRASGVTGPWFPWAQLGAGELATVALAAGFRVTGEWATAGRWFGTLRPAAQTGLSRR